MMRGQSQLFKFVADPPTVTMQRLKGLTTGGLPTFADISGSFGGANVDEDSWVQQLHDVEPTRRAATVSNGNGESMHASMAFVGDDTWIDLFPNQFNDSHPYPSFNTRDLDTVDDGCLLHLPRLLKSFGPKNDVQKKSYFEVVVSHFLGVDHVGHTYGPHNVHMDAKLNQMDDVLETIFEKIDTSRDGCQVAFVFGDHGMTEDGNHGGGTDEEINAALFAHYSPGCGDLGPSLAITGSEAGSHSELAFSTINQIDLVPTISLLLGLPIPYANLGGVVPALLPPLHNRREEQEQNAAEAPFAAGALALNAAQVWNYLSTYSTTANKLPDDALASLKGSLDEATSTYKMALSSPNSYDSIAYREACGLFKYFLSQATDLGKVVWTRFDIKGMACGVILLLIALVLGTPIRQITFHDGNKKGKGDMLSVWSSFCTYKNMELTVVAVFIVFQCALVTFSNSYILAEDSIIVFALSVICVISSTYKYLQVSARINKRHWVMQDECLPMVVAMCSRANELLVTGHGLDASIRAHLAHDAVVFIPSLMILAAFRLLSLTSKPHLIRYNTIHAANDIIVLICLAQSWWEKRSEDSERHGYFSALLALVLCFLGFLCMAFQLSGRQKTSVEFDKANDEFHRTALLLAKVALFIITVTGPSAASSCIFFIIQIWALRKLTILTGDKKVSLRFVISLFQSHVNINAFSIDYQKSFKLLFLQLYGDWQYDMPSM
jgi:phosphatidylinositol glycan class O